MGDEGEASMGDDHEASLGDEYINPQWRKHLVIVSSSIESHAWDNNWKTINKVGANSFPSCNDLYD